MGSSATITNVWPAYAISCMFHSMHHLSRPCRILELAKMTWNLYKDKLSHLCWGSFLMLVHFWLGCQFTVSLLGTVRCCWKREVLPPYWYNRVTWSWRDHPDIGSQSVLWDCWIFHLCRLSSAGSDATVFSISMFALAHCKLHWIDYFGFNHPTNNATNTVSIGQNIFNVVFTKKTTMYYFFAVSVYDNIYRYISTLKNSYYTHSLELL